MKKMLWYALGIALFFTICVHTTDFVYINNVAYIVAVTNQSGESREVNFHIALPSGQVVQHQVIVESGSGVGMRKMPIDISEVNSADVIHAFNVVKEPYTQLPAQDHDKAGSSNKSE
jgi:hypothetical protein